MATSSPVTSRQYARDINSRFNNTASNYVNAKDRWNQILNQYPVKEKNSFNSRLNMAIKSFMRKYPGITSFQDPKFRLCKAIPKKLSAMLIDTTIQRHLDVNWVITILENFVVYQAMPLQVYRVQGSELGPEFDPNVEYWASWEGQHTLMAFWIIATMIFGEDPDSVEVPTVEYDMRNRLECRLTFIANNSKEGKKILSPFELLVQKIFGVRLDGVTDSDWKHINDKQVELDKADLFLTESTLHNHRQPGAITRPGDLCDTKYSVEVVRQFCIYADAVLATNPRPIDTKELPIIMGFLKMAEQSNIVYSDDDVRSLAYICMNLFGADFDEAGFFWEKVGNAYIHWHDAYHEEMDESLRPGIKLNKDWAQGGTFFWWLLKEHWVNADGIKMQMPKLNISTAFRPAKEDLSW